LKKKNNFLIGNLLQAEFGARPARPNRRHHGLVDCGRETLVAKLNPTR
jgi:hypothetical protein